MQDRKQTMEMRKHKRTRLNGHALAAFFTPRHDFIGLGQILDISRGGLAIRYIALQDQIQGSSELELFGSHRHVVHIGKIPCRVVYDQELRSESRGLLKVRRCGVQFGELTGRQVEMLESFMASYRSTDDADAGKMGGSPCRDEQESVPVVEIIIETG